MYEIDRRPDGQCRTRTRAFRGLPGLLAAVGAAAALWVLLFAGSSGAGVERPRGLTYSAPAEPPPTPPLSTRERFGFVATSAGWPSAFAFEDLRAGWAVDFTGNCNVAQGLTRAIVLRTPAGYVLDPNLLGPLVDDNPGVIWLVGNEPDRALWQDSVLPDEYAQIYHQIHQFLKGRDPTSRVAPGGIVQPTPLRLQYLDLILQRYQDEYGVPLPADLWNIHNAILNEVSCDYDPGNCWGAGIPPGIEADFGEIRTIDQNDDMDLFAQQIWDFRQWMVDRGYGGYPLIISEYGVLMPELYGFGPDRVNAFMDATVEFFQTATDSLLGDPTDDGRLVQRWAWFSLDVPPYNPITGEGFNGNLFDPESGEITAFGLNYASHTSGFPSLDYVDLTPGRFDLPPVWPLATPTQTITRLLKVRVDNLGTQPAGPLTVSLSYDGPVDGSGEQLIPGISGSGSQWLTFTLSDLPIGRYRVDLLLWPGEGTTESVVCNNQAGTSFVVPAHRYFFPLSSDGDSGAANSAPGPRDFAPVRRSGARDQIPAHLQFHEFELPTPGSYPVQLAIGGDGAVWVTARDANQVARFDPASGLWQEYPIPSPDSQPWGIALDSEGHVWFAETAADQIGRLDPGTGLIVEYPIVQQGTGSSEARSATAAGAELRFFLPLLQKQRLPRGPWEITVASGGTVWFTQRAGNRIGRLDPANGEITDYALPTLAAEPMGIATSGAFVAFTESDVGKLGWLYSPTGDIEELPLPPPIVSLNDIALVSGNAWLTVDRVNGGSIGLFKVSTTQDWFEYNTPTTDSEPYGIVVDGESSVWFTERRAGQIARFDGSPPPMEYGLPDAAGEPTDVATDDSGCAWYTVPAVNRIGRFCPPAR